MEYLGFFNNEYHYTPTVSLQHCEPGWPRARVYKCPDCKIRWFRRVTADVYDGLCWVCYREQYDGMDDLPF